MSQLSFLRQATAWLPGAIRSRIPADSFFQSIRLPFTHSPEARETLRRATADLSTESLVLSFLRPEREHLVSFGTSYGGRWTFGAFSFLSCAILYHSYPRSLL
jgi:hypothetical protein